MRTQEASFSFDPKLLEQCVLYANNNGDCQSLFEKYCRHYGRSFQPDRFQQFQETVRLVYLHNTRTVLNQELSYQLTLNQFADQKPTDVISAPTISDSESKSINWYEDFYHQLWQDEETKNHNSARNRFLLEENNHALFVPLESEQSIIHWAQSLFEQHVYFPKPAKTKKAKKGNKNDNTVGDIPQLPIPPTDFNAEPFAEMPILDESMNGVEVDVVQSSITRVKHKRKKKKIHDPFAESLNWATTNNPDGVPLVHDAIDQGNCGSCWAFAVTGSLEASAARRAASEAYRNIQSQQQTDDGDNVTAPMTPIHKHKRRVRQVESDTFQALNLSIQELVDCDTAADQGCIGGNPILSFFFIHRYGLVPWEDYPYIGLGENKTTPTCQTARIADPIATVQSWGILPKNHEDMIKHALRHIGPVAVGVNGADPDFISYGGGIFEKDLCDQGSNHAMLVVGYGQETIQLGNASIGELESEIVRYWIARNSWGTGWGENGFVRIKRGPGGEKIPGICGIARSPSVALGGQILWNRGRDGDNNPFPDPASLNQGVDSASYSNKPSDEDEAYPLCDRVFFNTSRVHGGCKRLARVYGDHRALSLGLISIFCALVLVAWPLTLTCRRRFRHQPRRMSSNSAALSPANHDVAGDCPADDKENVDNEEAPLNSKTKNELGYGSTRSL